MEVYENANTVNVYEFRKKKATIVMEAAEKVAENQLEK